MRNKKTYEGFWDDDSIERILHDAKLIIHDLTTDDINELRNDLEWLYWKFQYTNYKRKYDKQKRQV